MGKKTRNSNIFGTLWSWWDRYRRILTLKAGLLALLPLLCCIAACAAQGGSLWQVYLPSSQWNDELFYYKQVEGILSHGYPQGYFGFNESHALKLSFAAWSPVLVWPWLLHGLLFGWDLMAPVYSNILLMTLAVFLFVLLTKPKWKQLGLMGLLFCCFWPYTRYMLCGMPEIICFSMLTVYWGLLIHTAQKETAGKVALLFVMGSVMTLMRPYLILFMLAPAYLWVRRHRLSGILGSLAAMGLTAGGYLLIKRYLGAEYFTPLFKTEWLEPFLQGHIFAGIKGVLAKIYYEGRTFMALTLEGLKSGLAEGAFFAVYLALLGLLLWQCVADIRKKRKKQALLNGYLAFCFFSMWMALLLMYKMKEGSKHLLTFMAVGILAVALMETRFYKKATVIGALCIYLFWYRGDQPGDYQIYFTQQDRAAQMEQWEETFARELRLREEDVPNFDNVVIWTFNDVPADSGEQGAVLTDWQVLYALPPGWGVSCCYREYVEEHLEELQSLYLAIPVNGRLQERCEELGMEQIGQDGRVCIYRTR